MYAIVPIREFGNDPWPAVAMVTYCPTGAATTIVRLSATRLMNAPWPPKIPLVGKLTADVYPALRPSIIRRSVCDTRSAARSQLLVAGRSSGPCTTGSAGVEALRPCVAGGVAG